MIRKSFLALLLAAFMAASSVSAQAPELVGPSVLHHITTEAFQHSQATKHLLYVSDVYSPTSLARAQPRQIHIRP